MHSLCILELLTSVNIHNFLRPEVFTDCCSSYSPNFGKVVQEQNIQNYLIKLIKL